MRELGQYKAQRARSEEWAVVDWKGFDVIQGGFKTREEAEEWLAGVPDDPSMQPRWVDNPDVEARIAQIA